eukprot:3383709-Amphidinium_carterae.1
MGRMALTAACFWSLDFCLGFYTGPVVWQCGESFQEELQSRVGGDWNTAELTDGSGISKAITRP